MFYLGVVFLLITVVGLIGNFAVILVIGVNRQLHDSFSTNFLICNLAIADLLFLTFCVPITAYSYIYSWHFSQSICYITVTLQYVTCYVSVWTLVLLSVERFLSIRNPTVAKSMRRSRAVLYICFSLWLLVFALNFPQMQGVGVLTFDDYNRVQEMQLKGSTIMACVDSLSIANENATVAGARVFYWGFNLGAYVLPLTLSTAFYLLLICRLWINTRIESKSSTKMKRHATKMVFIFLASFMFCWFPQNLRFFLRGLNYPHPTFWERDADLLLVVQSAIQIMAYANSCINPILYSAFSERFRIGLRYAWRRFVCCDSYYSEYRHSIAARMESSMQSRTPFAQVAKGSLNNKLSLSTKGSVGVVSVDWANRRGGTRGSEFLPVTPASNLLTPAANGSISSSFSFTATMEAADDPLPFTRVRPIVHVDGADSRSEERDVLL